MDLSKYPLEKLLYFVAGVIPGFVALLIFQVATPGSFDWFFSLGFLGYRTKVVLVVLTTFVVGNSMTRFLSGFFGAIGGAVGGAIGYKPPQSLEIAPWREPKWRAAVSRLLGPDAPHDMAFMTKWFYDFNLQVINSKPEAERAAALADLNRLRIESWKNDSEWARWYDHYHAIVLRPSDRDVVMHVRRGLEFNLETAAVYVLISAWFVPAVRHWWCILPACLWTLDLLNNGFWEARNVMDRWTTLSRQITYISEISRHAEIGKAGGEMGPSQSAPE